MDPTKAMWLNVEFNVAQCGWQRGMAWPLEPCTLAVWLANAAPDQQIQQIQLLIKLENDGSVMAQ